MDEFYTSSKDLTIKIAILSHPDNKVTLLLENLVNTYPKKSTYQYFSSISVNIAGLRLDELDSFTNRKVKLFLIQPVSNLFTDKLNRRYYETYGAVIFFSKNNHDEFVAAKAFYENFRKLASSETHPVAFVEVLDGTEESISKILTEPEIIEDAPYNFYYAINMQDYKGFRQILEFITRQFLTGQEVLRIISMPDTT